MKKYTERQVIMISETQANSLKVLKTYGVNVSQFIRRAIQKEIKAEWPAIKAAKNAEYCPF